MVESNSIRVHVLINMSIICKGNTNGRSVTLRNWFNKKKEKKRIYLCETKIQKLEALDGRSPILHVDFKNTNVSCH